MNITNWSNALETLSEKMPDPVDTIAASEHTIRMLRHHCAGTFDPECGERELTAGIRGYMWNTTVRVNAELKHGIFEYRYDDQLKGTLDFTMCPDGTFTPAIIQDKE